MKRIHHCVLSLLLAGIAGIAGAQEELEISADEFPRVPATEPDDVLDTFEIAPGFRLVLAAHEPDVADPIAMTFDERGRAWVVEMRGYSERREDALGRIRTLTDTNGDGIFDKSVIFKDGLKWPTAIACYKGGVFVGATPDVFYFRDTDGDDIADEERVVFTGFGAGKELRLNMQALFNSFRWGPDNRIWGATASTGGIVEKPGDPSFEPVTLRGADFSFDPEKLDLRPENGTAQYGMSFDSKGRRFVCSNSRHLVWVAYERGQVKANPWYSLPPALVNIPDDGAAAPVYRISPDEPWRIVRTRWRVAGVVKGMVEGGGRVSGYFTSATGVHLFWGDAYGDGFRDNAFVGDVGSNLVHRKIVRSGEGSVALVGTRPDPEEKTEFLRSHDNWFRPTSFANGPDGCLYITDMYREFIEHPWSLPEPIKKHLDLNSGFQRGRVFRVEPEGFERRKIPNLAELGDGELQKLVDHSNAWNATNARRLLYERGKPEQPLEPVSPFPALLASEESLLDYIDQAKSDPWMRAAVLNSLRTPEALAEAWAAAGPNSPGDLGDDLATMIGKSKSSSLITSVAEDLAGGSVSAATASRIDSFFEGIRRGGGDSRTRIPSDCWDPLVEQARKSLSDSAAASGERGAAIRLVSLLGGSAGQESLRDVLQSDSGKGIAPALSAAIKDLAFLVDRFESLPSSAQTELANRIVANATASERFLGRIEKKEIDLATIPASLTEGLRQHKAGSVKALAAKVFPPVVSRLDVIADYREALRLETDRKRGKAAFTKACVACHVSHEGDGIDIGPVIATFASAGGESLLERILDPNREVAPQYQAYVFDMNDGTVLSGIIKEENPEEVTVRMPGGIDRSFPRTDVKAMKSLGLSLMPEGLEATLTKQEMADLLAYLAAP